MSTSVLELLNAKVDALASSPKAGGIVTADKSASLPSVLSLLAEHDIRSIPIVDKENNDKLLGVVDMIDIVSFIVRFAEECRGLPSTQRNFEWFSEQLEKAGQTIYQIAGLKDKVDVVLNSSLPNKNKLIPVMPGTSIFDIMQIMVTNRVQRVPVVNAHNVIESFVTQSALVQYFAKHPVQLGKFAECSLSELGFRPKPVFSVKENAAAVTAFKIMSDHKITGVPIVDIEGEIITNVSSKDLRNVLTDPDFLDKLQLPIERFVTDIKSKTFILHNAETMYPKICCKFSNKFIDIIAKLAATKIHRIYVVEDGSSLPIGVISLDDVVSKVFELATKKEVHSAKFMSAH